DTVYAFVSGMSRSREDAEDATAETFERVLRLLPRYSARGVPITAWLIGIARNVLREHWRTRSRLPQIELDEGMVCNLADRGGTSRPNWMLASLLDELPPAQREVLSMRLAGLKISEIALALSKADGTVK